MTEYFAVVDETDRRGPFPSSDDAIAVLKQISFSRNHTAAQAHHFYLHESIVEQVDRDNHGVTGCIRVNWLAQEEGGSPKVSPAEVILIPSPNKISREHENEVADAHFTTAARMAAEINEGGPLDVTPP